LDVPVASLIDRVWWIRVARKMKLLVMFSDFSVVLADERVVEAELVGEDDRLAVLPQRDRGIAMRGMQRHHENAESHEWCRRT
jgi:hypothetical protein